MDLVWIFPGVQVMAAKPILALRGHRREAGANAEVLWSLCSSALLALWGRFWFALWNVIQYIAAFTVISQAISCLLMNLL